MPHDEASSANQPVVQAEAISKSFSRRAGPVSAIHDVSLTLCHGEFVAVRGKSGCGKSTMLLTLGGLQRPDTGLVTIAGQPIYQMAADQRAAFRARHIGFVFQQFHLIPYLTVQENVAAARLGLGDAKDATQAEARRLVERVGLADRVTHKPAELSIGECQRVAIARALMNQPALILADEPTGNLDEENTDIVLRTLREIADGGTAVLLVTHDAQCAQHVDRSLLMENGRLSQSQPSCS